MEVKLKHAPRGQSTPKQSRATEQVLDTRIFTTHSLARASPSKSSKVNACELDRLISKERAKVGRREHLTFLLGC
jgi:hypothetical protein